MSTDAEARTAIAECLDESLIVEAAAGTGKTTALVGRIVAVIASGRTTVDRVVAVTFTRKAAGELKLRLRQALEEHRPGPAGARLIEAAARLEEARVGTIHSFCAEILRSRPVEAGIDPAFVEADQDEARRLWARAFDVWIQERLGDLPSGLRRALTRFAGWQGDLSPLDRLRDAGWELAGWRDFDHPWSRRAFDRDASMDELVADVFALADTARSATRTNDYLARSLEPVVELATALERYRGVGLPDADRLERDLVGLVRPLKKNESWKGRGESFAPGVSRAAVLDARRRFLDRLVEFRQAADADLAAELRAELEEVVRSYEELKQRTGRVDFLDLLLATRDLVRSRADVRTYLQRRFTHLFVDEFQDTDPLQAEILLLLAADDPGETSWRDARPLPGKLFLVGDPKQSIYRFRRADVLLYEEIKRRLVGRGMRLLHLSKSFRAPATLSAFVNAAFEPVMDGDATTGQAGYVPLEPVRKDPPEQPSVVVVPVPRPFGWSRPSGKAVEASLPDALGGFLAWLLDESGWTVGEGAGRRSVRSRDVAILLRRFVSWGADVSRPYVEALERRGVPHVLVGGRSFFHREEVETLRAALTAIEWPEDELAVFATLKGPLFAIGDDELFRFRRGLGLRLHPFTPLPPDLPEALGPIAEALVLLADLHRQRNRVAVEETIARLLETTRAHAAFALRPSGAQVLVNVQHVCDLARAFEMRGGLSFRAFVERLAAEAEAATSEEAPVLEEGAEGVRVMTVHRAKGLEFPVVALADPTCRISRQSPGQFVDPQRGLWAGRLGGCAPWELLENEELEAGRDRAEGMRLAYVAATRARDLLVLPGIGVGPMAGWLEPLHPTFYPPRERYAAGEPAPGCPAFGPFTVLDSGPEAAESAVRPGLHRPAVGAHEVVWWDPALLEAQERERIGLRREDLLVEGGDAEAGLLAYERWRTARSERLAAGSRPTREVVSVTELDRPPAVAVELSVLRARRAALGRPGGARFGTLVHTVLRDVAFSAGTGEIEETARLQGRVLGASDDEVAAAIEAVAGALGHEVVRRAAAAERAHRELPFVLPLDGGAGTVEGVVDLAYEAPDGWVVVDFKTDADIDRALVDYRRQLSWYVVAVATITGRPARGVLLGV